MTARIVRNVGKKTFNLDARHANKLSILRSNTWPTTTTPITRTASRVRPVTRAWLASSFVSRTMATIAQSMSSTQSFGFTEWIYAVAYLLFRSLSPNARDEYFACFRLNTKIFLVLVSSTTCHFLDRLKEKTLCDPCFPSLIFRCRSIVTFFWLLLQLLNALYRYDHMVAY